MLQCPRCSNPLTVTHQSHDHDSANQSSAFKHLTNQNAALPDPAIIQYPVYQNCLQPTCSPQQQFSKPLQDSSHQQLQEARNHERMLVELQSLRIKALENQLQQVRLGHELMQSQLLDQSELSITRHMPGLTNQNTPLPPVTCRLSPSDTEAILLRSRRQLEQSCWYYGKLSWQQAEQLLLNTQPGTFFIRDSADPRFLYSLSLQRALEGPTSVRVAFARGKFSLDADDKIRHLMPQFDSIGSLISHYVNQDKTSQGSPQGKLFIKSPLFKEPPSLAHSARLQINKSLQQKSQTQFSRDSTATILPMTIPPKLLEYLTLYPLNF